jgi:hypothetical protein
LTGAWKVVLGIWNAKSRNGDSVAFCVSGGCDPLPDWDWVWVWVALGWPKRGPRATQASRKGHPWVKLSKCFICNKDRKMPGWGWKRLPKSPELPKLVIEKTGPHRRHRKGKSLKPTPIWDDLGCGGIHGEGEPRIAEIAKLKQWSERAHPLKPLPVPYSPGGFVS